MIETHPFDIYLPPNYSVLVLGSFPGKDQTRKLLAVPQWYYSAKRNQFWKILSEIYQISLFTVEEKRAFTNAKGIAFADIILSARRKKDNNLDENLCDIEFNTLQIERTLETNQTIKVLFTSRFVERNFKKLFPHYKLP